MFPKLLNQFQTMNQLLKEHYVKCEYTNVELKLEPNLFDLYNLYIDDKVYSITKNEEPMRFFKEVIKNLLNVLIEEEKYIIFHKTMNLDSIKEYEGLKEFLKENTYSSKWIEGYVEMQPFFYDEISNAYYNLEEMEETEMDELDDLTFCMSFEHQDQEYFLENWLNSPDRVRIMLNVMSNPNEDVQEILLEFFTQEAAMKTADDHKLVNEFYSDYERNQVAFDIKVYEDFVHPDLLAWEILSYDEEGQNRSHAIHSLIEEIENDEELNDLDVYNWEIEGKSGGYLVLEFGNITPKEMEKIIEIIEKAKENNWKEYQSLEYYRDIWDDIIDRLEELKEYAEEEDVEKMEKMLNEINEKRKERV